MNKIILLLFIAFATQFGFAQAPPQGINYQAVVYSDNGENEPGLNVPGQVLRNKNIRVRFTIIQNAANGTEVYKEAHTTTTDAFGMFSLVIGQGTQESSNAFSSINWGAGKQYLKVEIDKRGGTNYVTMSNQQLLSVPYALYSDKSSYAASAGNGITSVADNGNGTLTFTYADGSTYTTPVLSGLQGPQGAMGPQGPAGQNGTNGVNGTNGINGQNGLSAYEIWLAQGNTGTESDFLTAITGAQGPQGIAGQNGLDGVNGTNGQNGLSAYEIWLAQGNTGTESDFLTAITGAQGPQGIAGQNGTNGVNGTNGTNGTNGVDGKNTLAKTTTEAAGANCTTGGIKIEYGLDANNNGTLDASEINASLTKYVCNGAVGATGLQGPAGVAGATGATGAQGIQGIQGVAGANGTNGTNGTNGIDGKNTLAKTTTEVAGVNCTTGGIKIEYGLDANNNGALDASEINTSLTKYVCNGAVGATGATGATGAQGIQGIQGVAGTNGTNGVDGKNTLAKTTTEAAGANCTTGGIKIEYGLDANNNGTLDASEINATLTKYVCNGAQGTPGSQNAWSLTGNSGTNSTTNFIGTTDAKDFVVKTNNTEKIRLTSAGNLQFKTTSHNHRSNVSDFSVLSNDAVPISIQRNWVNCSYSAINNTDSVYFGINSLGNVSIGHQVDAFYNPLQITQNGNVGIGTSSPPFKLTSVDDGIGVTSPFGITDLANNPRFRLDIEGNNGTNTTNVRFDVFTLSDTAKAQIRFFRSTNTTGPKSVAFFRGNNTTQGSALIGIDGLDSYFQIHGGNFGIGTASPSGKFHVNNDISGSDSSFVVTAGGNVGIGTSSPTDKITVQNGGIRINGQNGIGFNDDSFANTSPNGWEGAKIYWEEGTINSAVPQSDYLVIEKKDGNSSSPDGGIAFANRGNNGLRSTTMVISGLGNVGIGTIAPARSLHINAVMRLEPIPTAPTSPAKGDMYFDSTINKLRVYDGTVWQNCW
ncbi:MAG: hypothetical protein RL264_1271 [Bacteroidota bacterium]|jgi:hypothetical protein